MPAKARTMRSMVTTEVLPCSNQYELRVRVYITRPDILFKAWCGPWQAVAGPRPFPRASTRKSPLPPFTKGGNGWTGARDCSPVSDVTPGRVGWLDRLPQGTHLATWIEAHELAASVALHHGSPRDSAYGCHRTTLSGALASCQAAGLSKKSPPAPLFQRGEIASTLAIFPSRQSF
jgi:hypothetical protein